MNLRIPPPVRKVFDRFTKAGFEIFLIGAGSRNLFQGKEPIDCDFTTNATPEETLQLHPHGFYDNVFGTVGIPMIGVTGKREIYEVTTYRIEGPYRDRRRPSAVKWGKSLEEDLARREFTISAIAVGPKRKEGRGEIIPDQEGHELEVVDLFDGRGDLERKLIRAVGDANKRFQEDALRMMRAVRIATQLGFLIDEKTFAAIKENVSLITQIAAERIRDELFKILRSDHPADGVMLLFNAGLLEIILPELTAGYGLEQTGHHEDDVFTHSVKSLKHCPSKDPLVRLAALLHDVGKVSTHAYVCSHCQCRFKRADDVGDEVVCPRCHLTTNKHDAATFYNHEMAGARLVDKVARRLRLSRKEQERLVTLVRWHQFSVDERQTDKAIRRFIRRVGKENLKDIIDLRVGDRVGSGVPPSSWRLDDFLKRIEEVQKQPFQVTDLKIGGHEVMKALGVGPGPAVGRVLARLFAEVEEDPARNTREYLRKRLSEIAAKRDYPKLPKEERR
jgi:tRNA nucleotidyltransferase/poly(A) polymerase